MECRIFLLLVTNVLLNISQTWSRKANYWTPIDPNNAEIYYADDSIINPWSPSQYYISYSQPRHTSQGRLYWNLISEVNRL
jgi:hypothetical protein